MREYFYQADDGREVPVSQMSTVDIQDCLATGVDLQGEDLTQDDIRRRLNLELYIRNNNLRGT